MATDSNETIASLAQTPVSMVKYNVLEYGHQKEEAKSYGDNHNNSKVESTDQDWQPLTKFGKALLIPVITKESLLGKEKAEG